MARKKQIFEETPEVSAAVAEGSFLVIDSPLMEDAEPDVTLQEPESEEILEEVYSPIAPEDRLPTVPQLCVAICMLVVVLGYPTLMQFVGKPVSATSKIETQQEASPSLSASTPVDSFADMSLGADAAYVWDVAQQKSLFNKNAQAQLPLASLTKLMTALVAYETFGDDATVPITLDAISQEGENGFNDGDIWNSKDLMDFTLMTSSNDGAYALAASAGKNLAGEGAGAEKAFVTLMNKKAEEIGLTQTYFTNPTGLDTSESQSGSYGSARDMAFLMEYIIEHAPDILEHTTEKKAVFKDRGGLTFPATNTNESIGHINNPLGSKTGYTVLAGGNLVVAFNVGLNHPIVISVLGSSRDGRFTDVDTLRERLLASYAPAP